MIRRWSCPSSHFLFPIFSSSSTRITNDSGCALLPLSAPSYYLPHVFNPTLRYSCSAAAAFAAQDAPASSLSFFFLSVSFVHRRHVLLCSSRRKQTLPARDEAVACAVHRAVYRLSTTPFLGDKMRRQQAEQYPHERNERDAPSVDNEPRGEDVDDDFLFASPSRPRWIDIRQALSHLDKLTFDALDQLQSTSPTATKTKTTTGTAAGGGDSPLLAFLNKHLTADSSRIEIKSTATSIFLRSTPVDDHLAHLAFAASNYVLATNAAIEVVSFCEDLPSELAPLRRTVIAKFGSISAGLIAAAKVVPDVCFGVDVTALELSQLASLPNLSATFVDSRCLLVRTSDTPPVSPVLSAQAVSRHQQQQAAAAQRAAVHKEAQQRRIKKRREGSMTYDRLKTGKLLQQQNREIAWVQDKDAPTTCSAAVSAAAAAAASPDDARGGQQQQDHHHQQQAVETAAINAARAAVTHHSDKVIDNSVLADLVPSFFVPLHYLLDKLSPLGYSEEHIKLYWASGKLHPLELLTLNNGNTFVRLVGSKGRFSMEQTAAVNAHFAGLSPRPALAAPFIDIVVAHARRNQHQQQQPWFCPLKRLIEMAPAAAVQALPFKEGDTLLFFMQLQHLFLCTPCDQPESGGALIALRPDADLASLRYIMDRDAAEEARRMRSPNDETANSPGHVAAASSPPPPPSAFSSLFRSNTPCPIAFNQLYAALLQTPQLPISEMSRHPCLRSNDVWKEMLAYFPSLEHFIAAHSECFVCIEQQQQSDRVGVAIPTLITAEAWQRNQIRLCPLSEQVAYYKRKGDTNALRKLRRSLARQRSFETGASSPYEDKDVLAQAIWECLPEDYSVVSLRALTGSHGVPGLMSSEMVDFVPSKGGIVMFLQKLKYTHLFEIVDIDYARTIIGVRRRRIGSPNDQVERQPQQQRSSDSDLGEDVTELQPIDVARLVAQSLGRRQDATAEISEVFKEMPFAVRSSLHGPRLQTPKKFYIFLLQFPEYFVITSSGNARAENRVSLLAVPV